MFSEILRATGHYTDDEVRLFERAVRERRIPRKCVLLSKGEISKSICYLLKGAVWQYDAISETEINVTDLHVEKEWVLNYQSLLAQKPSAVNIEAFTDCHMLELSLEAVHYLVSRSIAFMQLNRVLERAVDKMQFFDQAMSPAEKYKFILDHRPRLIQAFPLKIIASYLKITPETLSRVRKSMAREGIS
ncbi:cAMP-binding domain of CRP or a regulatory subunit of cAMP-dependent protein kinases [Dyadobacter sp. SG02]|uniref:Crp/Fnr family transcriptional regulator n=1 Tax=Dyadobacter sp. SG02 TaxID=1855291 RepID=UPI0008B71E51|nr:Crp/Fnr family transcriptional regulator [Dyadobacter sp. SG02]SEI53893.1 cAMP-binding domain of CRP or a regulatory subunit of cAMP-dependent protein kinases [Dyadobacter sp. SG02]